MTKKPKMSKGATYKKTMTNPVKGLPKVKAHPAKGGAAKGSKAKLTGKTSGNFKKMSPVKVAKGHKGGKTAETEQKNPFGAGDVIKYGFKK